MSVRPARDPSDLSGDIGKNYVPRVPTPHSKAYHDAHQAQLARTQAQQQNAMHQWHLNKQHEHAVRSLVTDQQYKHHSLQQSVTAATEQRQHAMQQFAATKAHIDFINLQVGHAYDSAQMALAHLMQKGDLSRRPADPIKASRHHLEHDEAAVHVVYKTILNVARDFGHEAATKTGVVADSAASKAEQGQTLDQTMSAMTSVETTVPPEVKTLWTKMIQTIHAHCGHPHAGAGNASSMSFGALSLRMAIGTAMTVLLTSSFKQIAHEMPGGVPKQLAHMYDARAGHAMMGRR